jgi:hypothetical protein
VPVLAYPNLQLPFILTTDASGTTLGAVLSQVQDGIERPLAYSSRQTNKAEQAYTTSNSKCWLCLGDQTNLCYLFGRTFLVKTDHAAITYLRKFADKNARFLRWSIKLSRLDFTVEHRAGSKLAM